MPGADVRRAAAADLPWDDLTFDLVVSQLVLNFLPDPEAGVAEMLRVTRPGGTIAACTWDYADGMTMLRTFWDAARDVDPQAPDEARTMRFTTERELAGLWENGGLTDVRTRSLEVSTTYVDFDDYWHPFLLGIGPGGAYATSLDAGRLAQLRARCFERLGSPEGAFTLSARAVAVSGQTGWLAHDPAHGVGDVSLREQHMIGGRTQRDEAVGTRDPADATGIPAVDEGSDDRLGHAAAAPCLVDDHDPVESRGSTQQLLAAAAAPATADRAPCSRCLCRPAAARRLMRTPLPKRHQQDVTPVAEGP